MRESTDSYTCLLNHPRISSFCSIHPIKCHIFMTRKLANNPFAGIFVLLFWHNQEESFPPPSLSLTVSTYSYDNTHLHVETFSSHIHFYHTFIFHENHHMFFSLRFLLHLLLDVIRSTSILLHERNNMLVNASRRETLPLCVRVTFLEYDATTYRP